MKAFIPFQILTDKYICTAIESNLAGTAALMVNILILGPCFTQNVYRTHKNFTNIQNFKYVLLQYIYC